MKETYEDKIKRLAKTYDNENAFSYGVKEEDEEEEENDG